MSPKICRHDSCPEVVLKGVNYVKYFILDMFSLLKYNSMIKSDYLLFFSRRLRITRSGHRYGTRGVYSNRTMRCGMVDPIWNPGRS